MGYFENKIYLAGPVDGADLNNSIAVFDVLNGAWAGEWRRDDLDVRGFFRTCHNGRRRLFAVNGNNVVGDANGAILMLNEGFSDEIYGVESPISDEIILRGYAAGQIARGRYKQMVLDVTTWNPRYTIEILPDGANEGYVLEDQRTKSRVIHTAWSRPDYDITNVNDDHGDPYREDYSVRLADSSLSSFPGLNGINFNQHQRWQFSKRLRARGGFIQVRVTNDRGRCNVHGIELEITQGRRSHGDKT